MLQFLLLISLITSALASVLPFATPIPTKPSAGNVAALPGPTVAPRCDGGCSFGGSESTLQASIVTTTIVSVTSVPCTTSIYITGTTTMTSTIYSTTTITSTMTEDNTVYIVHYKPTPIILSTVYESTIQLTETFASYWTTESGSDYDQIVTSAGAMQTGSWGGSPSNGGSGSSSIGSAAITSANGWTHVGSKSAAAEDNQGGIAAATAANDGWASGFGSTSNSGTGYSGVTWSGSDRSAQIEAIQVKIVFGLAVCLVLAWEARYSL